MTGVGGLARFILRLDRLRLTVPLLLIAGLVTAVGWSWGRLYPSAAERSQLADLAAGTPAVGSWLGPVGDPLSDGSLTAWRVGPGVVFGLSLIWLLAVARHSRRDDPSRELLLAGAFQRSAPVSALALVTGGAALAFAVVTSSALALLGFPIGGSLVFCLGCATCSWAIAGLAAVVAGRSRDPRTGPVVMTVALAVLWAVAIAGNVRASWLTWLSPFGWQAATDPFAGDRWWVLALPVAVGGALWILAVVAGWHQELRRPEAQDGQGSRRRTTSTPTGSHGLAWRLDGPTVAGWTVGAAVAGMLLGLARGTVMDFATSSPVVGRTVASVGGSGTLATSCLAAALVVGALAGGFFVVGIVLRLHADEADGRAGLLMAAGQSRTAWAVASLIVAAVGAGLLVGALGLGLGAGVAVITGSGVADPAMLVGEVLAAAGVVLPAVLLVAGLTVLLVGAWPRLAPLAWALMASFAVIALVGPMTGLPGWVLDLSPFTHTHAVPGVARWSVADWTMTGAAGLLALAGVWALRRRDVGTTQRPPVPARP